MYGKHCMVRLLTISIIVCLLFGCSQQETPPTFQEIETIYYDNKEDFIAINNYCINSANVSIDASTWKTIGSRDTEIINDDTAESAINRLMSQGVLKQVYKSGKTIVYILWESPFDMGCGIAYSTVAPQIAYMTELEPMSEDDWYYYVDDYNTWRINNS